MYQVPAQNGYEIHVIGKGENALCRIQDKNSRQVHYGTYDECIKWLHDRALKLLEEVK